MDQMKNFTAYEYKETTMRSDKAPFYLDCYESFGWQQDENFPMQETKNTVLIRLKRDRKLVNRTELTRLQRSFEAGMDEITALEHSKTTAATIWALCIGRNRFYGRVGVCRYGRSAPHRTVHPAGRSGLCGLDRTLLCVPHRPGQKDPAGESFYRGKNRRNLRNVRERPEPALNIPPCLKAAGVIRLLFVLPKSALTKPKQKPNIRQTQPVCTLSRKQQMNRRKEKNQWHSIASSPEKSATH